MKEIYDRVTRKHHPDGIWKGKKHKPESIEKMKGHMRQNGELNSQFGTCWVTDGNLNKKIKVIDLEYWMGQGFYKGRRIIKTTQI